MARLAVPSVRTRGATVATVAAAVMLLLGSARRSNTSDHPAGNPAARRSSSQPVFYKDVLPVLQDHCQVCHREGEIAPMAFVTYEQTRPWTAAIKLAVQSKRMPPWFADPRYGKFSNDPSLTPQQIASLSAWADAGAPAGDRARCASPTPVGTKVEHSAARRSRANAAAGGAARAWRCGVHLRNRAHRIHRRQMGADVGDSAIEPRARASCRGLHSSAELDLAASRSGGRAFHALKLDRCGRASAKRTEPPATCCWFMRQGARPIVGQTAWQSLSRRV